jgi:hypothetical protein
MHHDAPRTREQTGSTVDSSVPLEASPWSRIAAAIGARLHRLHVSPWAIVVLALGWAAIWAVWVAASSGWVPARRDGLTLSAISASAGWLSALLGILALRDLVYFNRRWARGEFHSARAVPFHPLWLPPLLFVAGLAFGRLVW